MFKRDRWGRFAGGGTSRRNTRIQKRITHLQDRVQGRRDYVHHTGDRGTVREQARDARKVARWNGKIAKLRTRLR